MVILFDLPAIRCTVQYIEYGVDGHVEYSTLEYRYNARVGQESIASIVSEADSERSASRVRTATV